MGYRRTMALVGALGLLIVASSFFVGRYLVGIPEVLAIVASKIVPVEQTWSNVTDSVVWDIRIPRILIALLAGAALSSAGTAYQGVFKNPLVSPDILGVSAAAGFGAALSIILFGTVTWLTAAFAFAMGVAGVACTYMLGRFSGNVSTVSLVLGGMVVKALFDAGVSCMKYMADADEQLPAITFWLMGSLSSADWSDVALCAPVVLLGCTLLALLSWKINILTLGDKQARSMGLDVRRMRAAVIAVATAMSAAVVCVCGTIGWVGLVIPHISRMLVGADYRKCLPASIALGAPFLLLMDNISRAMLETSIPISIVTAFVGAPCFALLLRKTRGGAI